MLDKHSRNLGTDGTITRIMVVNIKSMAHVCSNSFLSIFPRTDTIVFRRCLYYIDLQNWPIKPFTERKLLEKYSEDNSAMGKDCVWKTILLYSLHWICANCNKGLIRGKDFGTDYYCYYFHHYHCCCCFYYSFAFIFAIFVIVLAFLLSLLLVLVWLLPLFLSFS